MLELVELLVDLEVLTVVSGEAVGLTTAVVLTGVVLEVVVVVPELVLLLELELAVAGLPPAVSLLATDTAMATVPPLHSGRHALLSVHHEHPEVTLLQRVSSTMSEQL